jgi:hypothetical protein
LFPFETKSPSPPTDGEMSQAEAADALRMLAATIKNDHDFIRVLRDADPALREQVYNEIAPFVSYMPRPFRLMSFDADA